MVTKKIKEAAKKKTKPRKRISERDFDPSKHVKEYKRKCKECGKMWHSLASREEQIEKDVRCNACVQGSTACGGNLAAATQSKRNVETQEDLLNKLRKCPKCGSTNYKEEIIIYEKKR